MRRELILDSGIAETNDQFHAEPLATDLHGFSRIDLLIFLLYPWESVPIRGQYYFFSFFSPFSAFSAGAASAPSSSVSCLPFLITSGSAGAAAASAAAASGVATTSSFTEVTCATG